MAESQNVEYKESWKDDYLKWICGFANASGGRIYIGVRDDGTVVGVPNSKKLLEDISNKIRDTMGIGNRCILPEGWTVGTLMEPHDSIPYNPDIANVFYRAGFIENWGRGIETICSACRELGAEQPTYELQGNSLRVRFAALQSALIDEPNVPNGQKNGQDVQKDVQKEKDLERKVMALIEANKSITMSELANRLEVSYKTVQRFMDKLKKDGHIERKGGKRFGYWEIRPESKQ